MFRLVQAGYDEQGREQLGGKMVGTKKWIGPAGENLDLPFMPRAR